MRAGKFGAVFMLTTVGQMHFSPKEIRIGGPVGYLTGVTLTTNAEYLVANN